MAIAGGKGVKLSLSQRPAAATDAGLPQGKYGAVVTKAEQQRIRDWLKQRGEPQLSCWTRRAIAKKEAK